MTPAPDLEQLLRVAESELDPAVRRWRLEYDRLAALREVRWSVEVAARDLGYAREYAAHAPDIGAPPEHYLDRWTQLNIPGAMDLGVLWGPRYRARDAETPFVGLTAGSRPVAVTDLPTLAAAARAAFAEFRPLYLNLWSAAPIGAWAGTRGDSRLLAAPFGELRARPISDEVSIRRAAGLDFYPRYVDIHEEQVRTNPSHRLHTRVETEETMAELRAAGTLFEVFIGSTWAGVVAGEANTSHGLRGATVIELLLDPAFRGRGHGNALSVLLARHLPMPDDQILFGTIHVDNRPAYRSAVLAGRIDVGGEVLVPL